MRSSFMLAGIVGLSWALAPAFAEEAKKPNIIFIMADDLGNADLGYRGHQVSTPNIDKLAMNGVLFQNHFVTTSICCCSRASIFSGQYMRRHGIRDFVTPFTPDQWRQTYPQILRQNGYYTGFIGKFGVGNDKYDNSMGDQFDYWRGVAGQGGKYFIDPKDPNRTHETTKFGNDALEFIDAAPADKPFCLSVDFTAPHARDSMPHLEQYQPDDRDKSLFADTTIPLPLTDNATFFGLLPPSVQHSIGHERYLWRFDTDEHYEISVRNYYRLVFGIDREVGRIMDELQKRGLAQNTVVIYTSDNGYFLGDRELSDKFFMYEEGLRDPLIIADPRQPAQNRGRSEDAMTLNIDFAPTMLDLAGIKPPAGMQGTSLMPLVQNQRPADWRTQFFYEFHTMPTRIPTNEGVRTEQYSYIDWVDEKPPIEQLYDIKADPLEAHNLVNDPGSSAILAQLRAQCEKYRTDLK